MAEKQLGLSPSNATDAATKAYVDAILNGYLPVDSSNAYATTIGDGSATSIAVTHNLGTTDVVVSVHLVSTGEEVDCDVVKTTGNVVTLTFATAPASNSLRVVVIGTAFGIGTPPPVSSTGITDATATGRAVLTAVDAAAARTAIASQRQALIDVRDYGAVGDGIADDTAEIQAAIDAASAVKGTVFLPGGFNGLVTSLFPKSDVTIMGYGATLTHDSDSIKEIITNRGLWTPFENFRIYGVNFVGAGQTAGNLTRFGPGGVGANNERRQALGLYNCSNIVVQDCSASEFAYGGFAIINAVGVRIINNTLENCGHAPLGNAIGVGYQNAPTADFDTVITGNTVTGCQTAACCIQGAALNPGNFPKLTHIHHNNFESTEWAAIALEIGTGLSTDGVTVRRVIIDHNFCTQTGSSYEGGVSCGIQVSDNNGGNYSPDPDEFMSIIIDHNDIVSNGDGIAVNGSNMLIDHNNIVAKKTGIFMTGLSQSLSGGQGPRNVIVNNNIIAMSGDSTGHGITAGLISNTTISNNKVYWPVSGVTATTSGVRISTCKNISILDNEISWAPVHGIYFSLTGDVRCQGNYIYNTNSRNFGGNGIQWETNADPVGQNWFVDNIIVDDRATTLQNYPFNNPSGGNGNLRLNNNQFYALSRNTYSGTAPLEEKNAIVLPSGGIVGVTATQTLTNKTLTTPKVDVLYDTNGNESLSLTATASAVNYFELVNTSTNLPLQLRPGGFGDANVSINLRPRGSGVINVTDGTQTTVASFTTVTSPVNYWQIGSSATQNAITATAAGTDNNIGINLVPKGTGIVQANGNPVGVKVAVPANATAVGKPGYWAADSTHLYHYTGDGTTHTWVRASLSFGTWTT